MQTKLLFRENAYHEKCSATVLSVRDDGIVLDKTVFYPAGGGQPGDTGTIGGTRITDTRKIDDGEVLHIFDPMESFECFAGETVEAVLDWERRKAHMRMHTALHLLSVAIPRPVTGGSIGAEKSRLDFDMPEAPEDKQAIEDAVNAMIDANHTVTEEWISDEELRDRPELVKTMAVKPPMGQGQVRLVRIGDIDLQPCGGTHVSSTSHIGRIRLGKIEKKGKQNRRVNIHFA